MPKRKKQNSPPRQLYWDAGYLIAYFAPQDSYHQKAVRVSPYFRDKKVNFFTSWPTLSEASTLLLYHYRYSNAVSLLKAAQAFNVLLPTEEEYKKAGALFEEFNQEHHFSFNDVLSYVLVQVRLKGIPVLSFDKDFTKMGLTQFIP